MKIRTDFVTNSSSSSFVIYRIDDKKLAEVFKQAGLWYYLSDSNDNVVSGQINSESTGLDIPRGGSIVEWLIDSMDLSWDFDDKKDNLIKLLNEHKEEIDHNCRSAEFAVSNICSDGGDSSFASEERKGAKIIFCGIDENDWDYQKEGEGLWSFIEGDIPGVIKKAKELCGTYVIDDQWLIKESEDSIFDKPDDNFSFKDEVICVTGEFNFGSRSKVKQELYEKGASAVVPGVNKQTTMLLVGSKGSANWSMGNYGTKVEKALDNKKKGISIKIYKEDDVL